MMFIKQDNEGRIIEVMHDGAGVDPAYVMHADGHHQRVMLVKITYEEADKKQREALEGIHKSLEE